MVVKRTKFVSLQTKLVLGFSDPGQTQCPSNLTGSFSMHGTAGAVGHVTPTWISVLAKSCPLTFTVPALK